MSAATVKQRFEDADADSGAPALEKQQLQLRQLLPLTDCPCRLRIMDSADGRYDEVTMTASCGLKLLEKLRRSRVVDGELLLGLVPQLNTVGDSTLSLSVRVPPSKPKLKPQSADVDYAVELKELMDAVMEYNSDRDVEWDFAEDHGVDASVWTEEQVEEHDQILADIQRNRERIQGILRRVTGDVTLEF